MLARQILLVGAVFFCWLLPATANNLVIPVFFATDRVQDVESNNLDYTNQQSSRLSFGVKNIVLGNCADQGKGDQRIAGLGWWCVNKGATANDAPLSNRTYTEDDFTAMLKSVVTEGPKNRPLIVYVNGCCQPFNSSADAAAKLSESMQAPVLLYAWAALPPTEKKYRENEDRQHKGDQNFMSFLDRLQAAVPADQTVLIAHSMGNRFLHQGLRYRYFQHGSNENYPKYRTVAFTCADVNIGEFADDEDQISFNSKETWITANDTDPALTLSSIQRGLYGRLGAPRWDKKRLLGHDGVDLLDISRPYRNKHDFPQDVITQVVRTDEGGYEPQFILRQVKPHFFAVEHE